MRRRSAWLPRAMALLLLNCAAALALEIPLTPKQAAPSGPEAISVAEIPARASLDARFAQDVVDYSREQAVIDGLEARLNKLAQLVREQGQQFKREELRLLPVIRLESLDRHWHFYAQQFDVWYAALSQGSGQYLDDATILGRRKADWVATRAAAEASGVPQALLDRITEVQSQLAQAEQAISAPLDKLLHLGERAATVEEDIQAGRKAVTAAIDYNDDRLTQIDAPPLWKIDLQVAEDAMDSVKVGLQIESTFVKEYSQANGLMLRAYNIFEFVLLPLLVWISFRVRKSIPENPETQASLRVLRRPFSAWLLIVMTGLLIVERDAPIILQQVVLLIVLIPVLRLLPPHVFTVLGPWPYIVSGLYLLNLFSFVFLSNAIYHRFYLLFVTLLALGLFSRTLRGSWRRSDVNDTSVAAPEQAAKLVQKFSFIACGLLGVSAIANIFGNVSLADMLTDALLFSVYAGVLFYAGAHVLTSLMHLILARGPVSRLHIVVHHGATIRRGLTRLLQLATLGVWVVVVLNQFRIYRPIQQVLSATLTHTLSMGKISVTLGGVLLFLFSVWLALKVSGIVRFILRDEVLPSMSLPRGVANSIASLTYYFLVLTGLSVAMVATGFEVGQLAFVIGALGVGVGLGLQDVVKNFVSGLILMFERPIQPGDTVEIGGTSGTVRQIGMRATTLTTFDGADVVVPNGSVLSEKLINWTLINMDRRFDVLLGVAYGTDPKQVLELVMNVTKSTPGVAVNPEPIVQFTAMGANSLDFTIRAWTNDFAAWGQIRSDLTVRIYDAIIAAGIQIPFPQRDLHLRSISPDAAAVLSRNSKSDQTNSDGARTPVAARTLCKDTVDSHLISG
jgi:potassium-dependent mechanosensitive channel